MERDPYYTTKETRPNYAGIIFVGLAIVALVLGLLQICGVTL